MKEFGRTAVPKDGLTRLSSQNVTFLADLLNSTRYLDDMSFMKAVVNRTTYKFHEEYKQVAIMGQVSCIAENK